MNDGMIIPLAGIMLPMVLVPTIITLAHRMKKREWQHKERLRALELGIPVRRGRAEARRRDGHGHRGGGPRGLGPRRLPVHRAEHPGNRSRLHAGPRRGLGLRLPDQHRRPGLEPGAGDHDPSAGAGHGAWRRVRDGQAAVRARRLRRGVQPRLSVPRAARPPRQPRGGPDRHQRLDRDVEPRRDDRQGVEEAIRRRR